MTPDQMRRAAELLLRNVDCRDGRADYVEVMERTALAVVLRIHADEIEQRENFTKQEKD